MTQPTSPGRRVPGSPASAGPFGPVTTGQTSVGGGVGSARFGGAIHPKTGAPASHHPGPLAAGQAGYDPSITGPLVAEVSIGRLGRSDSAGLTSPLPSVTAPDAPAESKRSGAPLGRTSRARGPRRARLELRNVNPWTIFKFSCVLGLFVFFVWLIVVMLLFGVLDAGGVVGDINKSVTTINGPGSSAVITGGRVFSYALIIGAVNSVLFIALSTIGSVVYNLCADLVGGIEVTLSERDG
jgi:Transmembrane domain of unknown function (DUF3566)